MNKRGVFTTKHNKRKLMSGKNAPRTEAERWRMMFELGLVAVGEGENEAALSYFEPLWAQNPTGKRREELVRWLGIARWGAAYGREAEPLLREAHKNAPWDEDVGSYLGTALESLGKLDEAEHVARSMLALNPKANRYIVQLCEILSRQRKFEEASQILFEAKDRDSESIKLAMSFAVIAMKSKQEHEAIEWLLKEIKGSRVPGALIVSAHFSLGDLYDKVGEYEEAFKHYTIGNESRESEFNLTRIIRKREIAMKIWTPDRIKRLREYGDPDPRPTFIVGMPRSGTTLTEQVLGRHPRVFPAGELRVARSIPEKIQHMFAGHASALTMSQAFDALSPGQVRRAGQIYIDHIERCAGPGFDRVIDKMPGNIWHVGMLSCVMPNARFIFSRRDPRDVCFSCYFRNFRQEHSYSTELERCGKYCREVFKMAEYWQELFPEVSEDQIWMNSTYEKLVSEPEIYAKKLIEHVGLEWDAQMIDIEKESRNVSTLRTDQVGRKIDTKSMERWKRYEKYVGPIEEGLADMLPYIP